MKERDFIELLQERAQQQKKTMDSVPFPKIFRFITEWLSYHPWRFLIPLAFVISLIFRGVIGVQYTNMILRLFSGWL